MLLINTVAMVKSPAFNVTLLVRRATKRGTTAIQARDRHVAYHAMIFGARS